MREKLSYPVRIIISLLSIFLWSFPAEGQDSESLKKQLDQKLNSFARQYVSSRTIKIDSILIRRKSRFSPMKLWRTSLFGNITFLSFTQV